MRQYACIQIDHHETVGRAIEEWESQGWKLHTYNTAGVGEGWDKAVKHYLLFYRE